MVDQRILQYSLYYKILRIEGTAKIGRSIRIIMILSTFKYIEFEPWIRIPNILPDGSNLKKDGSPRICQEFFYDTIGTIEGDFLYVMKPRCTLNREMVPRKRYMI